MPGKIPELADAAALNGGEQIEVIQAGGSFKATLANVAALVAALSGIGTPEAVVTAAPGAIFWQTDGPTLWVKNTGTGNTGWLQLITLGT